MAEPVCSTIALPFGFEDGISAVWHCSAHSEASAIKWAGSVSNNNKLNLFASEWAHNPA